MNNKEVITKDEGCKYDGGDDDQKAEAVGFVSLMSLSEENTPRHLTVSSQSSQNHQVIWASQDQVQPHITISEGDHQGWGVQRGDSGDDDETAKAVGVSLIGVSAETAPRHLTV